MCKVLKIKDNIYWSGIRDWELRNFHGHELSTHRGSSYNSYILKDENSTYRYSMGSIPGAVC